MKNSIGSIASLMALALLAPDEALARKIVSSKTSIYVRQKPTPGVYTTAPFNEPFAIVYIRIPKTPPGPYGDGTSGPKGHFDTPPEVSHRVRGLTGPGQLVYRDRSGNERILFDCLNGKVTMPSGQLSDCLPMDPTVSFDGKRVIFSVLYADFVPYNYGQFKALSTVSANERGAQIFEIEIASGTILHKFPFQPGAFDTAPVYLPDGNVMFTSSRANELSSSPAFAGSGLRKDTLQLHMASADGSNIRRVGPHDRDGALHPFVMTDGRVLFSTWTLSHLQPFRRNNGCAGCSGALDNEFWLAAVDHTGGNFHAVFGRHSKYWRDPKGSDHTSTALHFATETTNGWICTGDYYRGNNMGGGQVDCFEKQGPHVEGPAPGEVSDPNMVFVPRHIFPAFTFGSSGDFGAAKDANGEYIGEPRDPMALPGNQLLFTFNRGKCDRNFTSLSQYMHQTPSMDCNMGIYKTTKIPASHTDVVQVVDHPDYHEFMARVAEPYSFIYGMPKPGAQPLKRFHAPDGPRCLIASSSMEGEVDSAFAYSYNSPGKSSKDCSVQGCKVRSIPLEQVKAIRFWEVLPNTTSVLNGAYYVRSTTSNRLRLLGDVALKTDGSFVAELPCDTPYVMAGVSKDGEVILRDQVPQSLRPGEVLTCNGCHLHSGRQGRPLDNSIAGQILKNQLSSPSSNLGIPKVGVGLSYPEIINGQIVNQSQGIIYEFKEHIVPILNAKNAQGSSCISCHSETTPGGPGGGFRLDYTTTVAFPGNEKPSHHPPRTWFEIVANRPSDWERPFSSKYVNMAFALESLFYWKAVGYRADGRTDATQTVDVDFGANAHSYLTKDQARIIKNWIDSGAYIKNE